MNVKQLPQQTPQVLAAFSLVFLLLAAVWMGWYVPQAMKLGDDFDSTDYYGGSVEKLNSTRFMDPYTQLDILNSYTNVAGSYNRRAIADNSTDDETFFHEYFAIWKDGDDPAVAEPIVVLKDNDRWVDRETYQIRNPDTSENAYRDGFWNPNHLPDKDEKFKFANPLVGSYDNTYVYSGEGTADDLDYFTYISDERPVYEQGELVDGTEIPYAYPSVTDSLPGSSVYLDYYERVDIEVETGARLNQYWNVSVNLRIPNLLYLPGDYNSTTLYNGSLGSLNKTTLQLDTFPTEAVQSAETIDATATHLTLNSSLVFNIYDNPALAVGPTPAMVNRTSHKVVVNATSMAEVAQFPSAGVNASATHYFANPLVSTHINTYEPQGSTTVSIAGGAITVPAAHHQSTETGIPYGIYPLNDNGSLTANLAMDYEEHIYYDPSTGSVIDRSYDVTVIADEIPVYNDTGVLVATYYNVTVQEIEVAYTEAQKMASLTRMGQTAFALRYANRDVTILHLEGEFTTAYKQQSITDTQEKLGALKLAKLYVPATLIVLALFALVGSFTIYYLSGVEAASGGGGARVEGDDIPETEAEPEVEDDEAQEPEAEPEPEPEAEGDSADVDDESPDDTGESVKESEN